MLFLPQLFIRSTSLNAIYVLLPFFHAAISIQKLSATRGNIIEIQKQLSIFLRLYSIVQNKNINFQIRQQNNTCQNETLISASFFPPHYKTYVMNQGDSAYLGQCLIEVKWLIVVAVGYKFRQHEQCSLRVRRFKRHCVNFTYLNKVSYDLRRCVFFVEEYYLLYVPSNYYSVLQSITKNISKMRKISYMIPTNEL